MKIVCVSDTHNMLDRVQVPEGDILLHAGDFTMGGTIQEISLFNQHLGKLPHPHKIVCAGNHDKLFEQNPGLAKSLITNAIYLEDSEVTVQGLRIYGSPCQPTFGYGWAFNRDRGADIKKVWDKIPEGLDFLITHGPPYGQGDVVLEGDGDAWETGSDIRYIKKHVGCKDLKNQVLQVKPRYHIFGHIHDGYGIYKGDHTTFVNASVCNEKYQPVHPPIIITV